MPHILVIDDEMPMRATLRQLLEGAGYEVSEAADGRTSLRVCQQTSVDLVITDLLMPEQEGLETIMALHATAPQIKIIAISGGGSFAISPFLGAAKLLGAHRTLYKPLDMAELLSVVAELLGEGSAPADEENRTL